jgi:hypothetical protein
MSYDMSACPGIFYCDEGQTIMKKPERKRETIVIQVNSELSLPVFPSARPVDKFQKQKAT